jgi:type IV pilus assembly protein PilB
LENFNPQFSKIGDILVYEKKLKPNELEEALKVHYNTTEKIGHILVSKGYINESDLVEAYALQLGHKHVNEDEIIKANEDIVSLIPEAFAKENCLIAIGRTNDSIIIAMEDPEDLMVIDTVKNITQLKPEVVLAGQSVINKCIENLYGKVNKSSQIQDAISNISVVDDEIASDELDLVSEDVSAEDAPFVKLVNLILNEAIKEDSSDIHIEPGKENVIVRIRIDGVLLQIMSPPISSLSGIVARIKILSKLNIAEHRLPQDGRMKIKTKEREIDVRVSILPTVHGEKVVLRLLGSGNKTLTLTNLGFPKDKLKIFRRWINQPYGMVIISGPTGSGKSTTLYAALQEIHSEGINITTVEDPVEYQLPGINQVQMHDEIGLNFSASLRSILRQDPDVLLIGEIRDEETAAIAVKFAMTGHLVFSTVHANDAPSTIMRLLDLGIPPFLLGSSLNLIMAQRLVRTIDKDSKEEYTPSENELSLVGLEKKDILNKTLYRGIKNQSNHNTGYKGRTAIHEIIEVDSDMKQLIYNNANQNDIHNQAIEKGMISLRQAGVNKLMSGETTIEEVLRATVEG